MADSRRRSALDGRPQSASPDVEPAHGARVTLQQRRPSAVAQIHGADQQGASGKSMRLLGLYPSPRTGMACVGDGITLLWNGPGQWLAVSDTLASTALIEKLCGAFEGTGACVIDLSHARTVVRVAGVCARELLMKGCPLDIESMTPGASAASLWGSFNVHLHCRTPSEFDIYVARSFGLAFWQALAGEAAEFGYNDRL